MPAMNRKISTRFINFLSNRSSYLYFEQKNRTFGSGIFDAKLNRNESRPLFSDAKKRARLFS